MAFGPRDDVLGAIAKANEQARAQAAAAARPSAPGGSPGPNLTVMPLAQPGAKA
jgi:hypothetical protein